MAASIECQKTNNIQRLDRARYKKNVEHKQILHKAPINMSIKRV